MNNFEFKDFLPAKEDYNDVTYYILLILAVILGIVAVVAWLFITTLLEIFKEILE